MNFKCWITESLDFLSKPNSKIVSVGQPTKQQKVIQLFRGFSFDPNELEQNGNEFILSPKKSEQNLIWFAHQFSNIYKNPEEFASGYGDHILTYPLQCVYHSQIVTYDDGTTTQEVPEEIANKSIPTENCSFYRGFELPKGWFFSYKTEKHIVCDHKIMVKKEWIK